jgi:hypothetical protein
VRLRFDPAQMSFTSVAGRYADQVDVLWAELSSDGRLTSSVAQHLELNLLPSSYQKAQASGMTLKDTVDLRPETAELRIVARDAGSGAVGSMNVPLGKLFAATPVAAPPK